MADCPGDTSVGPPRCVQCCKDWCKDKDVRVWSDIDSGNADDEQDTELAEERSATDDSVECFVIVVTEVYHLVSIITKRTIMLFWSM